MYAPHSSRNPSRRWCEVGWVAEPWAWSARATHSPLPPAGVTGEHPPGARFPPWAAGARPTSRSRADADAQARHRPRPVGRVPGSAGGGAAATARAVADQPRAAPCTGRCELEAQRRSMSPAMIGPMVPALIAHGGAGGDLDDKPTYRVAPGNSSFRARLGRPPRRADRRSMGSRQCIRSMEEHPRFNAGYGSALTERGDRRVRRLDHGGRRPSRPARWGAVSGVRSPIGLVAPNPRRRTACLPRG